MKKKVNGDFVRLNHNIIIDIDNLENINLKINPDYYIHSAILKAQSCLIKDDYRQGFNQYRQLIEHIEKLVKAANMLPNDYENRIKDFIEKLDKNEDKLVNSIKIADFKLELIMTQVFSRKISTEPLKNW